MRTLGAGRTMTTAELFKEIVEGKHDDLPEGAFLLKGSIDDVVEAAKKD